MRDTVEGMPWRVNDLVTVYLLTFFGGSLILAAWYGVSGSVNLSTEVTWLNVGVVGTVVAGVANVIGLLHARRAVGERARLLLAHLDDAGPAPATSAAPPVATAVTTAPVAGSPVAVDGGTRFHDPLCVLVAGKTAAAASVEEHVARGRRPCGVCQG